MLSYEIENGLEGDEFIPYFQPQIDGLTGRIIGVEALARWTHPTRGLLLPKHFLPAAERAGLSEILDIRLRRAAMEAYAFWSRNGVRIPSMSLNLTAAQLRNADLAEQLTWEAETEGIPPSAICLEILESVMFEGNKDALGHACVKLHQAGFSLSLDDFGTGHAAISTLINLPVSRLKIDRSFVHGVSRDARLRTLTRSIILMATSLEIGVLAEGIEESEDIAALLELGCSDFQGFHFAEPMPASDFLTWTMSDLSRSA